MSILWDSSLMSWYSPPWAWRQVPRTDRRRGYGFATVSGNWHLFHGGFWGGGDRASLNIWLITSIRGHTVAICLHLPKAYGTDWTAGPVNKLRRDGTQDSMLLLFLSYLTGRKFRSKMEIHFSEWKPILADVLQGCAQASYLYSVYVADILRGSEIEISQFPGDTTSCN